jgi:hypothetical protein
MILAFIGNRFLIEESARDALRRERIGQNQETRP